MFRSVYCFSAFFTGSELANDDGKRMAETFTSLWRQAHEPTNKCSRNNIIVDGVTLLLQAKLSKACDDELQQAILGNARKTNLVTSWHAKLGNVRNRCVVITLNEENLTFRM